MIQPVFLRVCSVVLLIGAGVAASAAPLTNSPRPLAHPQRAVAADLAPSAELPAATPDKTETALAQSSRPLPRPEGLRVKAAVAQTPPPAAPAKPQRGQLCGVPGIEGKPLAPIKATSAGCGLADGVEVTAVSGIKLSIPAKIDCGTAKALKKWVDTGIVPAVGDLGGGVKRLDIAGSYVCRTRNHQKGAKMSEHGRGRAVDLAGVTLRNGRMLTVTKDWKRTPKVMGAMHRSACGIFGTVLGPKSDKFHFDHIHVDTAHYSYGPYCR